jgi:uncharacterized protein
MIDQLTTTIPATLDEQALLDIVNGACILGSGGGGPLVLGQEMARALSAPGAAAVRVADPDQVPDDAEMAISAAFGSPDAASDAPVRELTEVAVGAFDALAQATRKTFTHVLLGEIGAGNALIPMFVAQKNGIPVVDAAGAPRAMPLLSNCVLADPAFKISVSPLTFSNGEDTFEATAPNAVLADAMMRALGGDEDLFPEFGGVALWSLDGTTMTKRALPRTLTRAWALGRALREAPAGQKVKTVCTFLGGTVLFEGQGIEAKEQTAGAFDLTVVTLRAVDGDAEMVIYGQNENLIAWRSDTTTPVATAPDLICYLTDDGRPFSNAQPDISSITPATRVAVIGVPAKPLSYGSRYVIGSFAGLLRQLGYPGPYVPLTAVPAADA